MNFNPATSPSSKTLYDSFPQQIAKVEARKIYEKMETSENRNIIKESDLREIAEDVKTKLIALGQTTAKVTISVTENKESSDYTTQKFKTEPIRISTTNGVMCLYNFIY